LFADPQANAHDCSAPDRSVFVHGGSEDGRWRFAISEVKAGADCSAPAIAAELRGYHP